MTTIPTRSAPGQGAARSARPWRAAAVTACAAACALIAACSSGGSAGALKPLSPASAIKLVADETQKVNSVTGTISLQAGSDDLTGTVQFQLKPSLEIEENLSASGGGEGASFDEILSGTALYLKIPGLSADASKPWTEIQLSQLSGNLGAALNQLIQNAQSSNPLAQTRELTGSKNARRVGTQTIAGVQTTHYAGTLTPSAAEAALPASLRKDLSSELNQLQDNISWNVWVDSDNNLRKLTESYTVAGSPLNLSLTITSINKPVTIAPPPASQVTVLPASALRNTGL